MPVNEDLIMPYELEITFGNPVVGTIRFKQPVPIDPNLVDACVHKLAMAAADPVKRQQEAAASARRQGAVPSEAFNPRADDQHRRTYERHVDNGGA